MQLKLRMDSVYEELEQVFSQFPKYHMKILSGDFNGNMWRVNILTPRIVTESLHEDCNDNGVTVVKCNAR